MNIFKTFISWGIALSFLLFLLVDGRGARSRVLANSDSWKNKEEPSNFTYRTLTTEQGLTFRVPEDMPIEKRDGIIAPIPFDEYMYGKFKQVDSRLQRIESKLERILRKLSAPQRKKQQGERESAAY